MLFHIILITAGITGSTFQFSSEADFRKVISHHESNGWTVAFDDELPMGGLAVTLENPHATTLIASNLEFAPCISPIALRVSAQAVAKMRLEMNN